MRSPERGSSRPARLLLPALWVVGLVHAATPILSDFGDSVAKLPAAQRARLQAQAARWDAWSEAQRAALRHRAAAWAALSPEARASRRERYAAWHRLPPIEQAQVRAVAARWRQMDPAQQQAWRARFEAQDGSTQRGWLLGPALGADYPRLQPLLAQVPAAEQAPLLRALRELTPAQRTDLAVLVQRTPPHERSMLRRELVSTAADQRQAWLWQRLDR